MTAPLLEVENLSRRFAVRRGLFIPRTIGHLQAVDGVSFTLARGETLGLVGESGSGKSTTARLVLRLLDASSGTIRFDGADITALGGAPLRRFRRRMQIVFQDPFASLNPRQTVGAIVANRCSCTALAVRRNARNASPRSSPSSGSRKLTRPVTRTSSPGGSVSVSASPGRWPQSPISSSVMSRSRHSMSRSRRRS